MGIKQMPIIFVLLISLFHASSAVPIKSQIGNLTDFQAAIKDMRAKSFYGFAILLQMLNATTQVALRDITFFLPPDPQLSNISVPVDTLEAFVLSNSMPVPLQFGDLLKFPSGTVVPSGYHSKMIRIRNVHGRGNLVVNNAALNVPNVCSNSENIKCHGVNKVIN